MKKIISLILLLVMLMSMVACDIVGNIKPDNGTDPDDEGFDLIIPDDETSGDDQNNPGGEENNGETTEPKPDIDPDPNIHTVYLLNRAGWEQVAIYYWGREGETPGGWPGNELSRGKDGLYRATFSKGYSMLIFNNNHNGAQTADLNLPVGDKIVYDNLDNRWITYSEAVALSGGTDHEHSFVDGMCECGAEDPYYDPENPDHYHIYINGKCKCGAEDPNYEPPHEHSYVAGRCECGVEDPNYVPPHEHDYVAGKCECGVEDPNYVPPHEHSYVAGRCECGAVDPNYVPDDPHEHSYVDGRCECGVEDPNYVPPHEHDYVSGKCECGAEDPNYVPPHEHSYVAGKCECGAEDPNYVPPHEHSYVAGKCECGAVDPNYVPEQPEISDEMALFNDLFDYNNHISIKLNISNSELKKIQQDYEKYSSKGSKSPIYRMADLVVTITKPDGTAYEYVIEQVGVRMKGNTSRTSFYSDNDGMYNLVHFKISFQETFDDEAYYGSDALTWADSAARKARKNRTFATLEKIDLRWNKNDDTTYIREGYAYDLYREFGVLAPHTNLVSMDIGKDHAGVWVMYEPVDKIFLEKNLPEEALGGDLYKLGWTNEGATLTSFSSYGVEDEDAGKFYVYDLKTNKKTSTHESLKNLINTINSSSVTKDKFASVVDIENFMYYCAVSYMIGNPDDLRNNYNNSYIYFRADTGKMIVIPYDMDRGLGVNKDWNPSGDHMTKDSPFSTKAIGAGSNQKSPLFLKSVCQGGFFVNEYTEALKAVDASELLTNAKFEERFNIAAALYSGDASTSKTYNNASGHKFRFDINRTCNLNDAKNLSFYEYVSGKRATLYKYIGDQGNTDNSGGSGGSGGSGDSGDNTQTYSEPYIMGDMNGWQVNSQYAMKSNGDGTYSFTLTSSHVSSTYNRIKFKIYDNNIGGESAWYGYEIVDPGCTVNYNDISNNSNGNKNIYLAPGTYVLTFDAKTITLYIEKK